MTIVREKNDLGQWYKFFLVGVIETAKNGINTFDKIMQLQKQTDRDIQTLGSRAVKAKIVIDYLYKRPLITADKISEIVSISMQSSYKLIADLEKLNILKEMTGGQRGRMYAFDNYIKLFR